MIRGPLRKLDDSTGALAQSVASATKIMRSAADDPQVAEGDLRSHLRSAAQLVDSMATGHAQLIKIHRRTMVRLTYLSVMFLVLTLGFAGLTALFSFGDVSRETVDKPGRR